MAIATQQRAFGLDPHDIDLTRLWVPAVINVVGVPVSG